MEHHPRLQALGYARRHLELEVLHEGGADRIDPLPGRRERDGPRRRQREPTTLLGSVAPQRTSHVVLEQPRGGHQVRGVLEEPGLGQERRRRTSAAARRSIVEDEEATAHAH